MSKLTTKPVIRKVETRRWEKAIAPNHNNHSTATSVAVKLVGWGA